MPKRKATQKPKIQGTLEKISGFVIRAKSMAGIKKNELVMFDNKTQGEVIQISEDKAYIQCYESTDGLTLETGVSGTGRPLSVELGPGLLGSIFDGIQRPLLVLDKDNQKFLKPGSQFPSLDRAKKWAFAPMVKNGERVEKGQILGTVKESEKITHHVMAPHSGVIDSVVPEGSYRILDEIAKIDSRSCTMLTHSNVREPRPIKERLPETELLITGQRALDTYFPIMKGGTAAVPGGFGCGKTVLIQQIAQWSDADIMVVVLCGERGNEAAHVISTFPEIIDPYTNRPLMERTVLIANTSNMPLAARESSIYMGITIAEYYRDMGYNVGLVADSTSRWAEALRETSSRLEEMPGEEGYPTYLASRLAEFYERAGKVRALSGKVGSLTVMGAVSPAGGDFSEPVTQSTLRVVRTFWSLDSELAYRRHYPAVDWIQSYSLYLDSLRAYFEKIGVDFMQIRDESLALLADETKLRSIVEILGEKVLTEPQLFILEMGKIIRTGFLQQSSMNPVDSHTTLNKQYMMIKAIMAYYRLGQEMFSNGNNLAQILEVKLRPALVRLKEQNEEQIALTLNELEAELSGHKKRD